MFKNTCIVKQNIDMKTLFYILSIPLYYQGLYVYPHGSIRISSQHIQIQTESGDRIGLHVNQAIETNRNPTILQLDLRYSSTSSSIRSYPLKWFIEHQSSMEIELHHLHDHQWSISYPPLKKLYVQKTE